MKDLIDWITAIATVVLVYAALRHPLYPPRFGAADDTPGNSRTGRDVDPGNADNSRAHATQR
ncbi:hypothetical protein CF70_023215 [Cupriavidus sp. SK-3]|uniref:hypothetical protein n=1 Tax=unclassified Cupriavidus TaxID=2640874 RepID=UPI000449166D|nr:hypothetical protein [Cupriavidus sp. SK-3]KDP83748.1 hypothetical protein CF70_023215 [Cupriavidus sp. SK-3]